MTLAQVQKLNFLTCPKNLGQIVTYSYASTEDYIFERRTDGSDGSVTYYYREIDLFDNGEDFDFAFGEPDTTGFLPIPMVV